MRFMVTIVSASMLAMGFGLPAMGVGSSEIPPPAALSPAFVTSLENKAGCVSVESVSQKMLAAEEKDGGKTLALSDGIDQTFADEWRRLARVPLVRVRMILAHGFDSPDASEVRIEATEFDTNGCAITRTWIQAAAWDAIVDKVNGGQLREKSI